MSTMNIALQAHVLPDVLVPGLRVVFCGSAAGAVSAARGAYYAGPGNLFWPTLYRIGLVPRIMAPADFREVVTWGIGLTDVAKTVSGADSTLPKGCFDRDGFLARISTASPLAVAFNGKRAARAVLGESGALAYGPVAAAGGVPAAFVLPSTSGLARRFWDIGPWSELAAYLKVMGNADRMGDEAGERVMGDALLTHPTA
jgi:TDG/mug DNA glycosylase family protein